MSFSKAATFHDTSGDFCCPRCDTPLPPHAAFCSSCGERLDKKQSSSSLLQNEQEISIHYRITSLVRRRPYVNLYFALENQRSRQDQQRMVAIRDIDLTSLNDEARMQAMKLVQQEYDLLRHRQIPHILPMIDLRYFKGHLYAVSGYPLAISSLSSTGNTDHEKVVAGNVLRLHTLQDFLQSGQGLPTEQQALTWIQNLCQALNGLHQHHIVIGELDPYTIMLDENSDKAKPALMISWLSPQLQKRLRSSEASTRFWSYFGAPEALQGKAEPRSDIYSLGAVLYLLLSGSLPSEKVLRTKGRLRSPHELNSRVSLHVSDCVMQALDTEPSKRFQSALEMSEALSNPRFSRLQAIKLNRRDVPVTTPPVVADDEAETIRIVPLSQKHLARWQASRPIPQPEEIKTIQAEWQQQPDTKLDNSLLIAAASVDTNVEKDIHLMQELPAHLAIGARIRDRYIVESLLGQGTFGNIYLTRDLHRKQELFALAEVINPGEQERYNLTLDYVACTPLNHRLVPDVQYTFHDDESSRVYLLMRYIDPNLEILRLQRGEGYFQISQVLDIMVPLIDAVTFLHQQQPPIIHGSIQPATIVLPKNCKPVVLKLGIIKEYDSTMAVLNYIAPSYGAIEQYKDDHCVCSDIYGLGATCYTLITGNIPPDALTRSIQLSRGETDPLMPIDKVIPAIPTSIAEAVRRAMSIDADDRFSSAEQFCEALVS